MFEENNGCGRLLYGGNCCDPERPPEIGFYFVHRNKNVTGAFCNNPPAIYNSFNLVLSNYHQLVEPENLTVIVVPPNPTSGVLHNDISVAYERSNNDEIEPSEGICFDTAEGGYNATSAVFNYKRSTNPDLRVAFRDSAGVFYKKTVVEQEIDPETGELVNVLDEEGNTIPVLDENGEPITERSYFDVCAGGVCCPSDCGSPGNPFLEGDTLQVFESLSKLTTTGGGGCGADYFNFCGTCDPQDEESGWPYCSGDGETPITLDSFDREVYTTNTQKSCASPTPRPGMNFPSGSYDTTGTYTREQKSTANCCFAFVCLAQVQQHPGGEITENTGDTYNIATFPPIDEYISAQLGEPTLIEDIIAQTEEIFAETPYSGPPEDILTFPFEPGAPDLGYYWSPVNSTIEGNYPVSEVRASRALYSIPFSSFGFGNSCQLELSASEYQIGFSESSGTCYVKLWFDEEFLPFPVPESWPINPFNGWPKPQVIGSFSIEKTFPTTKNNLCFVEFADRGFVDGGFFPANFILHDEVRSIQPPSTAGTNFVRLRKYSFVKGYEPNDPFLVDDLWSQGCKPNGFPINPATEDCGPELTLEPEPEP